VLVRDLRHTFRALWRAKGFTAVAVLCIGLGVGLNTTIFSVVDGVLLKPLPYADPDALVEVMSVNQRAGVLEGPLSYGDLKDLAGQSTTLTGIAGTRERSFTLTDGGNPERYLGSGISWNLFPLLGITPQLGSSFGPEDEQPGAQPVAILSDALWRLRYNADPQITGRVVIIDGVPTTVVGVMPARFEFPQNQKLWVPLSRLADPLARQVRSGFAVGRLAPGATLDQVRSELAALALRLAEQFPDTNRDWSASAQPLRQAMIPDDVALVIWLMMGGVTLVLFIACANVANLQLARATSRRREIAVRASLGAGRGIIIRQLLTEAVALSFLALPLGLIVAQVGSGMIFDAMPVDRVPYYITWEVDTRSAIWAVTVAVSTAVLFGLFPAFQATRGALHEDLKEGTRGNSARRSLLRSTLVVAQVSLALVALVGALMFVRSFRNLDGFDVGFDPAPLLSMRFAMPDESYGGPDARARRVQDVIERVEALPGVEAAFASNLVPLQAGGGGGNIVVDGLPSEPGREPGIGLFGVTPHFFRTLGVQPIAGRDFTDADGWSRSDIAVVNQAMADRFWPGRDAVGGRFRMINGDAADVWFTVVGVVPDVKTDDVDPDDVPFPAAFVSYLYQQTLNTGLTVRVASGDPAGLTTAVRGAIHDSDRNLPIFQVATVDELRRLGYWQYGLFGWVFGAIGLGALLLAAIGVYGVLSYAVSQRVPEIGVRVALGASRGAVVRLIVTQGLGLAAVGVVIGTLLAPAGTWASRSFFYNVSPFDPLTFALVAVFLLAVAFAASYIPALRATRIDPLTALRES